MPDIRQKDSLQEEVHAAIPVPDRAEQFQVRFQTIGTVAYRLIAEGAGVRRKLSIQNLLQLQGKLFRGVGTPLFSPYIQERGRAPVIRIPTGIQVPEERAARSFPHVADRRSGFGGWSLLSAKESARHGRKYDPNYHFP